MNHNPHATWSQSAREQIAAARGTARVGPKIPVRKTNSNPVLVGVWREAGIPAWCIEYRFEPTRRWRMDFAWPMQLVFIECQGGILSGGRHTRGTALMKEYEKLNAAAAAGWRCLLFTPGQLLTAECMDTIKRALKIEER